MQVGLYGLDREKLLRATAYHEAGHAVVAYHYGKFIREEGIHCDVNEPGNGRAHVRGEFSIPLSKYPKKFRGWAERKLSAECEIDLGGYAAEFSAMRLRGSILIGVDCENALQKIMTVMERDEEYAVRFLQLTSFGVKKLVRRLKIRGGIERIADALLSAKDMSLDSDYANELLENSGVPQVKNTYWCR